MKISVKHAKRVHQELAAAGISKYGLGKREALHLPEVINEDEHIHGAIYGLTDWTSSLIVATDTRVLHLDHKPFFNKTDQFTYEVVSGVSINYSGPFAAIVLNTRIGDFKLRFVNTKCAENFVEYIESRRIQSIEPGEEAMFAAKPNSNQQQDAKPTELNQASKKFLLNHEVATLSTVGEDGCPYGAVVFYVADNNGHIYIVTKDQTTKAKNIDYYPMVGFTIHDLEKMQTLQLQGVAHVETDPNITSNIYKTILNPHSKYSQFKSAPIKRMPTGDYEVIVIQPTISKFSDHKS